MIKSRAFSLFIITTIVAVLAMLFFRLRPMAPISEIVVEDSSGRQLNERGVAVADWEGYIANPAIRLTLIPPTNVQFPAQAVLTIENSQFYFDLSPECLTPPTIVDPCPTSSVGPSGPKRVVIFGTAAAQVIYLSVFPSRTLISAEHYQLSIQFVDSDGASELQHIPIYVIQQQSNQPPNFKITLDFTQDTTGFFNDLRLGAQRRTIAQQAADDWAYYIDGTSLDTYIASPLEQTWVWNSSGETGSCIENKNPYSGLLIYVHGVDETTLPYHSFSSVTSSENCPRAGRFTKQGIPLYPTMWRSGEISLDIKGSYNTLGWFLTRGDNDWYAVSNARNEPSDLYSIVHHEVGHVLGFNSSNSVMAAAIANGRLDSPQILAYNGSSLFVDSLAHLHNNPEDQFDGTVDKISRKGAFGNEYNGLMPNRRWLITTIDLIALRALGWNLRQIGSVAGADFPN